MKVSPMEGLMRIGKKGNLSSQYVGPYQILRRVRNVAYELDLPASLGSINPIFYISMLKKFMGYPSLIFHVKDVGEGALDYVPFDIDHEGHFELYCKGMVETGIIEGNKIDVVRFIAKEICDRMVGEKMDVDTPGFFNLGDASTKTTDSEPQASTNVMCSLQASDLPSTVRPFASRPPPSATTVVKLSRGPIPPLQSHRPLSTPIPIGATTNVSVPATIWTMIDERRAYLGVPPAETS
ncbi:putative uroporphyrinogen decarboxylase, chloroplastic-like [Capsicum annuum]|nr:putative uroporphyrinogen decarboxylase, chloroplastic-like [Capsicum annuum]KAF3627026.1 putative uroporphyrinogen decarboxylase, chloroplastic-like [Capsicum annuum]